MCVCVRMAAHKYLELHFQGIQCSYDARAKLSNRYSLQTVCACSCDANVSLDCQVTMLKRVTCGQRGFTFGMIVDFLPTLKHLSLIFFLVIPTFFLKSKM